MAPLAITRDIRTFDKGSQRRLLPLRLLRKAPPETCATVANQWRAPLYSFDLRRLDVRPAELRVPDTVRLRLKRWWAKKQQNAQ